LEGDLGTQTKLDEITSISSEMLNYRHPGNRKLPRTTKVGGLVQTCSVSCQNNLIEKKMKVIIGLETSGQTV